MNRHFFSAALMALTTVLAGCDTAPPSSAAAKSEATGCAIVKDFPVCDADIRARFAELIPADKLLYANFNNWGEPVTLTVTYTPEIVAPNVVKTKIVVCTEYEVGPGYGCELTRPTGYYDTDPGLYILAGNSVDPEIAKKVVHLWMQGKLVAEQADWLRTLRPQESRQYTLNYALHGVYTLDFNAGACGGPVYFKIEGEGDAQLLHLFRPPEVMCV